MLITRPPKPLEYLPLRPRGPWDRRLTVCSTHTIHFCRTLISAFVYDGVGSMFGLLVLYSNQ
jgi:hypothetical protein